MYDHGIFQIFQVGMRNNDDLFSPSFVNILPFFYQEENLYLIHFYLL